jgi:ABC-type transport system involved in cytochrome bd biosynthesis fused ATPase/permease subunit
LIIFAKFPRTATKSKFETMTHQAPSIHLDSGLEIGYGSPLARFGRVRQPLSGGTHFLLARNGRGKTTLLRTLARSLKPVSGNFRTEGSPNTSPRTSASIRKSPRR